MAVTIRSDVNALIELMILDIMRLRERQFGMAKLCTTYSFVGKMGDNVKIPTMGRLAVHRRIPGSAVRSQAVRLDEFTCVVDYDLESSVELDELVSLQTGSTIRRPITTEISYAQTRYMDNVMLGLRAAVPTSQQVIVSSTGTAAGDPQALTRVACDTALQYMIESAIPYEECTWVFSPQQVMDLGNQVTLTSKDFTFATQKNGIIGTLYGLPVMMTPQISNNNLTGYRNGAEAVPGPTPGVAGSEFLPTQDPITATLPRGKTGAEIAQPFQTGMLIHPSWAVFLPQKNITVEVGRDIRFQSDLVVGKQVFGTRLYRTDACFNIHTRGSSNPLA